MKAESKRKISYMLSYEYAARGKKEFIIGFFLGLLLDVLVVLGIIAAAVTLLYAMLVVRMCFR